VLLVELFSETGGLPACRNAIRCGSVYDGRAAALASTSAAEFSSAAGRIFLSTRGCADGVVIAQSRPAMIPTHFCGERFRGCGKTS